MYILTASLVAALPVERCVLVHQGGAPGWMGENRGIC